MSMKYFGNVFACMAALSLACSCTTSEPVAAVPAAGEAAEASPLAVAQKCLEDGKLEEALRLCVELDRKAPETPGLSNLKNKTLAAIVSRRTEEVRARRELALQRMTAETIEQQDVPDTYGLRRQIQGLSTSHRTELSPMAQALTNTVSMHLKGVTLATFIDAISKDTKINIVADQAVASNSVVDIEMDNVPIVELLEYIERNLGVSFFVGQNMIWVTKPLALGGAAPLETRIYRLRRGLQFHGSDWASEADKAKIDLFKGTVPALTEKATVLASQLSMLESVVNRFVPSTNGADFMLDRNSHIVIARNTRENLAKIETLIDAMDVVPPQVLIEARFVETTVSDLRELGIEWILGSTSSSGDGQVAAGSSLKYDPYTSDDSGPFPLGPVGDFGEVREGNPATSDQGLNLTYQGVLNDTMFQAVLHALEISGKGEMLSVPRVTTVNNNPAKLRNGEDLRYFDQFSAQAFSLVGANNTPYTVTVLIPTGKPILEELGITLVAVPSVGADNCTVSLLLMPTISRLEGWSYYQETSQTNSSTSVGVQQIAQVVAKLPIFSRREIQTKVSVDSGETVVLGGLIETVKQETVHQVPYLSSIPLIGQLFRRIDVSEQRRNLLIFVTATVVSERGETLLPF